jgi:hypothetical protein
MDPKKSKVNIDELERRRRERRRENNLSSRR